jgi:predicted dehydrogenase
MNTNPEMSPHPIDPRAEAIDRRSFLKAAGSAAVVASMAGVLRSAAAEQPQKPVVLAFVGCAHIHTPGFIKLLVGLGPSVRVKYAWDHDPAKSTHRAAEMGAAVASDLGQILGDPEVVAVVICSETNRHRELVLAAAAAGKHIYAEKPLGITAKDSREMADAIGKAGILFTTGYFMRAMPQHIFLVDQVRKGAFGKITRLSGSNCHNGSLGGWFDDKPDKPWENWRWMADPAVAGVGAFGDLGTHMLDIMMLLGGDVDSVSAETRVVTGRYGSCDEAGEALLRFKNGIIGNLAASWVDVADPVTLQVSGTEGNAAVVRGELFFKSSHVEGADGKSAWTDLPKGDPAPLEQFVNALGGHKGVPLVPVREAAERVAVMEAAYASARAGSPVRVS